MVKYQVSAFLFCLVFESLINIDYVVGWVGKWFVYLSLMAQVACSNPTWGVPINQIDRVPEPFWSWMRKGDQACFLVRRLAQESVGIKAYPLRQDYPRPKF